ncbi:MAG: hypothetical protein M1837_006522 [Sclerophora amabilis]|nr:MAG: hypothetical protein M1837_006522 [Sclerophora amabilis]
MSHQLDLCGCYYLVPGPNSPRRTYLPQVDVKAGTTILSTTSRTVLSQAFLNPSPSDPVKEASYTFPLYDGVSVVDFTCRIGSRVIFGIVKEKDMAKKVYDDAVARGETAGLLERLPDSADIFTTQLGNVPAGETVVVEITYLGELKHDAGVDGIRFTLPTVIAPRYGTTPAVFSHPTGVAAHTKGGIQVTIDISMDKASRIRGIQSPSHPIAVNLGSTSNPANLRAADFDPCSASATLSLASTELEKDFVLLVLADNIATPKAVLETHPTIQGQRALMATLVPKFSLPASRPEIVFVADRSGSMGGAICTLISALKVFLKSLPIGVKFNICSFGSSYSFLWARSKAYDQTNLNEAIRHVEQFQANLGGTEMFDPIKAVIENRFRDLPLEMIVLTDGEIWQQERLFTYLNGVIKESEVPIRVFSLGLGNSVSHSLVEGLGEAGNGLAQIVGINEKLDGKVVRMLKGALSPHITNYTLEVKYEAMEDDKNDEEITERVSESFNHLLIETNFVDGSMTTSAPRTISLFDETVESAENVPTPASDEQATNAHLPKVCPPKLLQAPHKIPPLFQFTRTVVYLLLSPESTRRTPKCVVLRATSEHGPLELEIPVQALAEPQETIHQLAAKKAVGELEKGRGWLVDATDEGGVPLKERFEGRWDEMLKREAVRLGVQFQVGGKWCSFVAVESNEAELAAMKQARQEESTAPSNNPEREESRLFPTSGLTSTGLDISHASAPLVMYQDPGHAGFSDAVSNVSSTISTGTFTPASVRSHGSPGRMTASVGPLKDYFAGQSANVKYLGSDWSSRTQMQLLHQNQPAQHHQYSQRATGRGLGQGSPWRHRRILADDSDIDQNLEGQAPTSRGISRDSLRQLSATNYGNSSAVGVQQQQTMRGGVEDTVSARQGGALFGMHKTGGGNKTTKGSATARGGDNLFEGNMAGVRATRFASVTADPLPDEDEADDGAGPLRGAPMKKRSRKSVSIPKTDEHRLHLLVALQTFEGSWELDESLLTTIGVDKGSLSEMQGKLEKSTIQRSQTILATILAILFFEVRLPQEKESWELIVDKARAWLDGETVPDVEALFGDVKKMVQAGAKA